MAKKSKKEEQEGGLPEKRQAGGDLIQLPQDPSAFFMAMQANLGNVSLTPFDLDRIRIPTGGGLAWTIPSLEGELVEKELEGVIVAVKTARAYWESSFDESGGGTPPDCSSDDGIIGVGSPGGECNSCPLAQFGSQEGRRGQACKQILLLFMVLKSTSDMLPKVVVLPPTSLKAMRQFLLRLASRGLASYTVLIALGLEKDKNSDGIVYSKVKPTFRTKLSPQEAGTMQSYVSAIAPLLGTWRPEDFRTAE